MSKKFMLTLLVAALALSAGCKSELDNKSEAVVNEPAVADKADEAKPAEAPEALDKYAVDVSNSSIGWVGAKVTGDHTGGFNEWTGDIYAQDGEVKKLEFTVNTASVFSDNERLTGHLKSEDFFHVKQYPEAKFVSTNIVEKAGEADFGGHTVATTHEVTGDFTVRGVTKSVTFPVVIASADDTIKAETEFKFKRFDFDIAYKGKADDLIRDEVLMKVALVAPTGEKQASAAQ